MTLNDLARQCHETAVSKGWYDTPRNVPELIALCHSELSEALEEYRDHRMDLVIDDGKPIGFPVEIADLLIRVLDMCAFLNVDIHHALQRKMEYNKTREYRHGGKAA